MYRPCPFSAAIALHRQVIEQGAEGSMAVGSILLGIVAGLFAFATALLNGHGLGWAFGAYVAAGFVTSLAGLALVMLRPRSAGAAAQPLLKTHRAA
jgi:hypothetical protein